MKNNRGSFLVLTGLLFVAAALLLSGYNLYDEYRASQTVGSVSDQLEDFLYSEVVIIEEDEKLPLSQKAETEVEIPDYILNPDMEMPIKTIDGQDYIGVLEIPSCDLKLSVMSEWSYKKLKLSPCRYEGSAYKDSLIIAAHNYRSHFGSLEKLVEGDAVIFTDMDGNVFSYKVADKEILMPTAVEEMTEGDWDLTLFTCTVGGSYRVTVRCEKTEQMPMQ